MSDFLPVSGGPKLKEGAKTNEALTNKSLALIERMASLQIKDKDLATPPTLVEGECFIVGASATGDWSGKDGQVAVAVGSAWAFIDPSAAPYSPSLCYVEDEGAWWYWDKTAAAWQLKDGKGTAFPANPTAGGKFIRTDLDLEPEFKYDGGRSKWLGHTVEYIGGWQNFAETDYLKMAEAGGLFYSTSEGIVTAYDCIVVGWTWEFGSSTTTDLRLLDDGIAIASAEKAVSSSTSGRDMTLNSATIAAGSSIGLRVGAGTANQNMHIRCFLQRVAT